MNQTDDPVRGDLIAEFYDQHPYPPPPTDLDAYRQRWREPERRRAEHHLHFPGIAFREDPSVLIAGCGTSQAARHALRWPQGRVVGIDVSPTSLQHTADFKQTYNLDNLELHQLPIERVGELGQDFDLIISTGVIHHLADPGVGLQALANVLDGDGAIHLMVYAKYGRQGISMMQEYGRLLGLETADVRDLAGTLAEVPGDHPIVPLLRRSPDFRNADALADALLNPRERAYSVPDLLDLLGQSRLEFGRWYRQAPYLPNCGFPAKSPHHRMLLDLPTSDQFAAMELLRGSMTRHTVIAHIADEGRDDGRSGLGDDSWKDDSWKGMVPIRLPNTILVTERLPPGAAAVLINQAHTDTDLILPITEPERSVLERIDGRRTIADTAAVTGTNLSGLRGLYQRLWRYDQVVFDNSERHR